MRRAYVRDLLAELGVGGDKYRIELIKVPSKRGRRIPPPRIPATDFSTG